MADWDAGDDWDAPKNGGDDWDAPAAGGGLTDKWDGEDEDEGTLLGDDWDEDPAEKETETKVLQRFDFFPYRDSVRHTYAME